MVKIWNLQLKEMESGLQIHKTMAWKIQLWLAK
jgi:hypothetical protein